MSTIAHADAANPSRSDRSDLRALRTERQTALIRIGVTAAVMAIYISSIGIRRSLGPTSVAVLGLAAAYSLGCLVIVATKRGPTYHQRVITLLIDILLVTTWIQATGGQHSEFWTLYLIVMLAAAMRFRLVETVIVAVGVTVMFLAASVFAVDHLESGDLILRATVMVATAFALGVIARQRAEHRRERTDLRALADTRERELGHERAEV